MPMARMMCSADELHDCKTPCAHEQPDLGAPCLVLLHPPRTAATQARPREIETRHNPLHTSTPSHVSFANAVERGRHV